MPLEVSRATKTATPEAVAVVAKEEKLQPFLKAAAATSATTSNAAFEGKGKRKQSPFKALHSAWGTGLTCLI